jgi:hypothetical protein
MKKLVVGLVVIGFGVALVIVGRPTPVSNTNIVGPNGFTFQIQPISLPNIQNAHIEIPVLLQGQNEAIVLHPVVAGVKVKPAVPSTSVEQTQIQAQPATNAFHSCGGQ